MGLSWYVFVTERLKLAEISLLKPLDLLLRYLKAFLSSASFSLFRIVLAQLCGHLVGAEHNHSDNSKNVLFRP
jgi:hypothetical protein